MSEKSGAEPSIDRKAQNRYAREVIAGNEVQLSHRASNVVASSPQRATPTPRSIPLSVGTPRTAYLIALVAILIISFVIYAVLDFESATVGLFVLSLVMMAGWFVFPKSPQRTQ